MGLWDSINQFIANGQDRRAWLDDKVSGVVDYYTPPELRPVTRFVAEMNPIRGIENSMSQFGVAMNPNVSMDERRRAAVNSLTEGLLAVAPAALAARGYMKPAQATMEGLLGGSPATQQIGDDLGRFMADEAGSVPIIDLSEIRRKKRREDLVGRIQSAIDDVSSGRYQSRLDDIGAAAHREGLLPLQVGTRVSPPSGWNMTGEWQVSGYFVDPSNARRFGYKLKNADGDTFDAAVSDPSIGYSLNDPTRFGGGFKAYSGPRGEALSYRGLPPKPQDGVGEVLSDAEKRNLDKEYEDLFGGLLSSPTLPAPRNEAEAMARDILDLRAAGRASEVTDDMMAKADPQYMFNNTPLPMDEASRMARADEHWPTDAYHGGRGGYDRLDPDMATGKTYDTGTWATDEPDIAATYTGSLATDDPAIYPLRLNTSNYGTADWANQMWGDGYPFTRIYNPKGSGLPVTQKISDISEDWQSWASTDNAARAAGSQGLSGLQINRVVDVGPSIYSRADNSRRIPDTSTSFSIQDPTTARSRFARFDPEFRHLANLSAGIGGLGLLGYVGNQSSDPLQTPRAE